MDMCNDVNKLQDPFSVFKTYVSIKSHFLGTYDYVKYHGRLSVKRSSYEKRKDIYFFEKLSTLLPKNKTAPFFVAQFIEDENLYISDILFNFDMAMSKYKSWDVRTGLLWENLNNDVGFLLEKSNGNIAPLLITKNHSHNPEIMNMLIRGNITPETYTLLNKVYDFIGINKKCYMKDDILFDTFNNKYVRYETFLTPSKEDIQKILLRIFEKHKK